MARTDNKLTVTQVRNLKQPGRYNDGAGLYLYVHKSGNRYWVFRYRDRVTGKHRDKGLGPVLDVTLQTAREKALDCRNALRDGFDPIDMAQQARIDAMLDRAQQLTFGDCAKRYIEAHRAGWSSAKHAAQWAATVETYCEIILPLPVADVDTTLVLCCLEPIWTEKTETATRVRGRIESVLDWATARKYRMGENPARWRGHLDKLLPKPGKLKNVQHRPALDYRQVGAFMVKLRAGDTLSARVLELQILTATRPGEAVGARWTELDLENKIWTIPAERMKANKEHEIPLSPQAVSLLKQLPKASEFVFPGIKQGKHITAEVGMRLLRQIEPGITAHGFRSTFRDWAGNTTSHAREVCEHALAHQLTDRSEAAYSRSTLLLKRTELMTDWANYCDLELGHKASVTPIRGQSHG